jgi:chromosome partitioning protein
MMEHACPPSDPATLKRRTPWNTLSARVIAVVSRKGGVGKTTSAVNLGAAFALTGHSVLLVGTDPQCGVAPTLGTPVSALQSGLLDLWEHDADLHQIAQTSPLKDLLFVSPRVTDLASEERYLAVMEAQPDVFCQQIDRARNLYDTIIIDCPPHLGAPTKAAINAADSILVPAQAEELCRESLGALLGALDAFKESHGNEALDGPELEGIFLTMLNARTRMGRHVAARVAEEFGPILFETVVPRNTRLSEMALRGKPSVIYDRRSSGSRAYFNLADEIMTRYRLREGYADDADFDRAGTPAAPEEPRPAQLRAQRVDAGAAEEPPRSGGLDRLIGDLQATGNLELPNAPQPDEIGHIDLVSLDELLQDEEQGQRDSWENGWPGLGRRFN